MRTACRCLILLFSVCCMNSVAWAVIFSSFVNADAFIKRAADIVVAECVSLDTRQNTGSELQAVEVNILKALKGSRKPGGAAESQCSSFFGPVQPGVRYMLSCGAGRSGAGGRISSL